MDRVRVAIGMGRAMLGWLCASFAGAISGLVLFSLLPAGDTLLGDEARAMTTETAAFLVFFIFVFASAASAIVAPVAVIAIRALTLPRPWTEMAVASVLAATLPFAMSVLSPTTPAAQILAMLAVTVPSGAVAGAIYWLVAAAPLRLWAGLPR